VLEREGGEPHADAMAINPQRNTPPSQSLDPRFGGREQGGSVRLSELVGALSHALDLTEGQPRGHAARSCAIGMRIARELGLGSQDRSDLYYAILLKDAGCSSNAAQTAEFLGSDDQAAKRNLKLSDWSARLSSVGYAVRNAAMGRSFRERVRQLLHMGRQMSALDGVAKELMRIRCERGADIVRNLGFPEASAEVVRTLDEHWDGRGQPLGLRGEEIPLLARIASLAQTVEVFAAERGWREALRVAADRRGTWFDPELVRVVEGLREGSWWSALYQGDPVAELPGFEPDERILRVDAAGVDRVAEAFASVVDAKSPYTYRHSARVAELARGMARSLGHSPEVVRSVYRAALLHDIGKLGISNLILDKPAALTPEERTLVEGHPLMTWSILQHVEVFHPIARMASVHHERLDGAGYPWGIGARQLDQLDRVLSVCDVFEALTAHRPYRAGMELDRAFGILRSLEGRALDPELVRVLEDLETENPAAA
jgi:putative nucleotidyltransferase with HDIG domain